METLGRDGCRTSLMRDEAWLVDERIGEVRMIRWGKWREGGNWRSVHDHLLTAKERVADEFAGAQRDRLLAVCHVCGLAVAVSEVVPVDR